MSRRVYLEHQARLRAPRLFCCCCGDLLPRKAFGTTCGDCRNWADRTAARISWVRAFRPCAPEAYRLGAVVTLAEWES
jgi:hypothetical protein